MAGEQGSLNGSGPLRAELEAVRDESGCSMKELTVLAEIREGKSRRILQARRCGERCQLMPSLPVKRPSHSLASQFCLLSLKATNNSIFEATPPLLCQHLTTSLLLPR